MTGTSMELRILMYMYMYQCICTCMYMCIKSHPLILCVHSLQLLHAS